MLRIGLQDNRYILDRYLALLSLCCSGLSALKVLRSLHNNTQQPAKCLVDGKNVVAPVVLIREKTAKLVSPLSLAPLPQNNILAYSALWQNECVEIVSPLVRVL